MGKGALLWRLSSVITCVILFLPYRECDARKQEFEARLASQQHAANTLDYEENGYDPGLRLSHNEYESYEQVDETVDDYDWYEDYYKKYESFARHTMMSEVYQPEFIIENAGLCKSNTTILILVNSRIRNRFVRDKIREIYKQTFEELGIAYGFFLSKPGDVEMRQVLKESNVWGDVIMADSEEAYTLLTIKTAYLLHWVSSYCPNSTYVAKIDDDVYVNVARLLSVLDVSRNYTVLGKVSSSR
ncbi:Beta-1,3-galactosyltransferase 4 [Portunus trituberculatus]|uniref:Hexosyltransferase n=1 Tax=Portunus trituberculatus TaxID=210409 RepID=A0A5B7HU18_PORTR|nr:Beta-1,3-galactosyltransferase 4 [Portunus trituberculatus]